MLSRRQPVCLSAQGIAQAYSLTPFDGLHDELVGIATQLTGTAISLDAPLMSAGLDSIGATEFSARLNERLKTELPPTLLFDYPSLRFIAGSLPIESGDSSAPETA